jgi:hypothetical protein
VRHVIFSAAFTVSGNVKTCTIILLLQTNLTKSKCDVSFINTVKVKQSRYGPGVAQRIPGS